MPRILRTIGKNWNSWKVKMREYLSGRINGGSCESTVIPRLDGCQSPRMECAIFKMSVSTFFRRLEGSLTFDDGLLSFPMLYQCAVPWFSNPQSWSCRAYHETIYYFKFTIYENTNVASAAIISDFCIAQTAKIYEQSFSEQIHFKRTRYINVPTCWNPFRTYELANNMSVRNNVTSGEITRQPFYLHRSYMYACTFFSCRHRVRSGAIAPGLTLAARFGVSTIGNNSQSRDEISE